MGNEQNRSLNIAGSAQLSSQPTSFAEEANSAGEVLLLIGVGAFIVLKRKR